MDNQHTLALWQPNFEAPNGIPKRNRTKNKTWSSKEREREEGNQTKQVLWMSVGFGQYRSYDSKY